MDGILRRRKQNQGFTLVEVIVVLVILAILAAILVPSMIGWIEKAEEKEVYTELNIAAKAAKSAYVETYAAYGQERDFSQLLYNPSYPSKKEWDKMFSRELEAYLGSDLELSRVQSIFIAGPDYNIAIRYLSDKGKVYLYTEQNGQVDITVQ